MSSETRNEQTGEKGEEGIRHQRNAEVEGHVVRNPRSDDAAPEVEGHIVRRSDDPGDDEADWVGGRGEEGFRRD